MRTLLTGFLAMTVACGGGGAGRIEISGRPSAEASATLARGFCRKSAACGNVVIECVGGATVGMPGGTPQCTATIEPVSYDGCYADAQADLAEALACRTLTVEQEAAIEDCFNAIVAQPCPTQAQADARARQAEAGTDMPPARPASCAAVDAILGGCP